jgi:nicotinamidase-related amidase
MVETASGSNRNTEALGVEREEDEMEAPAMRESNGATPSLPTGDSLFNELDRRPDEPLVRGQAANGFDRTVLDTILRLAGVDTLVLVGIATDVAVESTARAASDLGCRTIVVSDACTADTDEAHAHALDVFQKWFGETPTADEVLSALAAPMATPARTKGALR